jgi:hypothetical protein
MRRHEFVAALEAAGLAVTMWDIRHVLAAVPTERRHGHIRYTQEHMEAARAYADRAGLIRRTEA